MSAIIGFVHQKGGVGKTTLAICVAGELAKRGRGLTLVDADKSGGARSWSELGKLKFPVIHNPIKEGEVRAWAHSIKKIRSDTVLIDCAPNDYSIGAVAALANVAVLPCGPSGLDIEGTVQALQIIDEVRARRKIPLSVVVVPNRIDGRTLEGRQLIEELKEIGETVGPILGYRTDFVRAYSTGEAISTFSPGGPAHREIGALADVLLKHLPRHG